MLDVLLLFDPVVKFGKVEIPGVLGNIVPNGNAGVSGCAVNDFIQQPKQIRVFEQAPEFGL